MSELDPSSQDFEETEAVLQDLIASREPDGAVFYEPEEESAGFETGEYADVYEVGDLRIAVLH